MRELKDRYEIFLKVCETGSFSKAAEALNYTQSGISQMMAGLEEELGVQLFARINRGVTLTDNGTRLLPYVRELANQKDRLRQAAFNINHKVEGKLRVGSISSITTRWMPEVVHYFKKHYPKVEMAILDGNYDEIRDWIIHGQIDCGFLSSIVADDLAFYPLLDDPLCAVFPEGHPLAAQESVTLPQLFQYPLIIETPGCDNDIQHLIHKCPVKPDIAYSFRDDPLIMAFVRSGLGVTISQELVMQAFGCPGVVSRPLEPASCRTLGLAFSKTASSVVSRTLLTYLQNRRPSLLKKAVQLPHRRADRDRECFLETQYVKNIKTQEVVLPEPCPWFRGERPPAFSLFTDAIHVLRVFGGDADDLRRIHLAKRRDFLYDIREISWIVPGAALRYRCHVRAVRLEDDALDRDALHHFLQLPGILKGHDTADTDI